MSEWVSLLVRLFPNSSNGKPQQAETFRDDSHWDKKGFRLKKNIRIRRTVSRRIACIVGMYTSNPSSQFYSLQCESSMYLQGWWEVGRLISDRMSYRTHYMCSGEATSHSRKAIECQWVSGWVCPFVCSLTPPKRLNLMSWHFEGWFPMGFRRF